MPKCRFGLLRRKVQNVDASLAGDAELERRGHEMVIGIDHVGASQFVTVPFQDSLDSEPAHL